MGQPLFLESFDPAILTPAEEPEPDGPPDLGYEEGYRTGREAGLAEARAEQGRLQAELAERFSELSFTSTEARTRLLESLRPLFAAISETLLPSAAQASLVPYVAEVLLEAAEADTRTPISLLVAPTMVETIRAIADAQAGNPVIVDGNPGLGEGEVLIRSSERETMLALDRLVEDLRAALSALFVDDNRRSVHD